jgi:hypothetical protein
VAEPGQAEGDVGGGAADVLGGGTVGGAHDVASSAGDARPAAVRALNISAWCP